MHSCEPILFAYLEIRARIRTSSRPAAADAAGPRLSQGPATSVYGTATSIVHDNLANEVMPSPGW